jgi:glycerate-2-kinase
VTAGEAGIGQLDPAATEPAGTEPAGPEPTVREPTGTGPAATESAGTIIGNASQLLDHGLTELRRVVLDVVTAGLRAADPGPAVDRLVRLDGPLLRAGDRCFDLDEARSVVVLGAGKASLAIAAALERKLGDRITAGLIVSRRGTSHGLGRVDVVEADHPVPSAASLEAARRLTALAAGLGPGDLLITAFTGGSSALACLPPDGVPFAAKQHLHALLLESGASVTEINTVRKHVSAIKGGRLAERAAGAAILNLTVSDVVGDPVDLLCDPAVEDTSTTSAAIAVLRRHGLWSEVPAEIREHLHSEPSQSPSLAGRDIATVVLVAGPGVVRRMEERVHALGWRPAVLGSQIEGEAASLGGFLGPLAAESSARGTPFPPGTVLLAAGGEATVTVRRPATAAVGHGGPNQELALAFARAAARGPAAVAGAFLDSDGSDGGTDAAGGCVDSTTAPRAEPAAGRLDDAIAGHDSTAALSRLGDLITTGPTGTNVSDLWVIAIGAATAPGGTP